VNYEALPTKNNTFILLTGKDYRLDRVTSADCLIYSGYRYFIFIKIFL